MYNVVVERHAQKQLAKNIISFIQINYRYIYQVENIIQFTGS